MNLNGILNTGVTGLKTFQIAMSVTTHNITNVNTEGYSRQRAELATAFPILIEPHIFGAGVQALRISRLRADTLDATLRNENSQLGRWSTNAETLRTLETALGDPTKGTIGNALSDFWNGFQDLSLSPEDAGAREALVDQALRLADAFHSADRRLDTLNEGLNLSVSAGVSEINTLTRSLAQLNGDIARAELSGATANDLRDRRDLMLDSLSKLVNINVTRQTNGMVDVDVNGDVLVSGLTSNDLTAVLNAGTGHMDVQLGGSPLAFTSGSMQGYVESYAHLDNTRAALDTLAGSLISEVNALHGGGFDLNGNPAGNFFSGTDAGSIDVEAAIRANASLVAASTTASPGGNDLALQIAQLRDKKVIPGGTPVSTLNESFNNLVLTLGSEARRANESVKDFATTTQNIQEQREAISGVNMDEELSNMLTFQRSYEAASRVITTVDAMMDQIINRMGLVGR